MKESIILCSLHLISNKCSKYLILGFFQQLGKVLEGWKNQDQEKTVTLEKSRQEKKKLDDMIAKQQQVMSVIL